LSNKAEVHLKERLISAYGQKQTKSLAFLTHEIAET
jgi:hypothetical protein